MNLTVLNGGVGSSSSSLGSRRSSHATDCNLDVHFLASDGGLPGFGGQGTHWSSWYTGTGVDIPIAAAQASSPCPTPEARQWVASCHLSAVHILPSLATAHLLGTLKLASKNRLMESKGRPVPPCPSMSTPLLAMECNRQGNWAPIQGSGAPDPRNSRRDKSGAENVPKRNVRTTWTGRGGKGCPAPPHPASSIASSLSPSANHRWEPHHRLQGKRRVQW
jgi:hypothetical protein